VESADGGVPAAYQGTVLKDSSDPLCLEGGCHQEARQDSVESADGGEPAAYQGTAPRTAQTLCVRRVAATRKPARTPWNPHMGVYLRYTREQHGESHQQLFWFCLCYSVPVLSCSVLFCATGVGQGRVRRGQEAALQRVKQ